LKPADLRKSNRGSLRMLPLSYPRTAQGTRRRVIMTTPNSEQPHAAEEASAQETTLRELTTRPDTNYLRSDGGKLMDLFELGHTQFKALTQELAAYGLHVDPTLELRRSNGLLC